MAITRAMWASSSAIRILAMGRSADRRGHGAAARLAMRQAGHEGRAGTLLADQLDVAAVAADDLAGREESDARAGDFLDLRIAAALEFFEDAGLVLRRNAQPVVL